MPIRRRGAAALGAGIIVALVIGCAPTASNVAVDAAEDLPAEPAASPTPTNRLTPTKANANEQSVSQCPSEQRRLVDRSRQLGMHARGRIQLVQPRSTSGRPRGSAGRLGRPQGRRRGHPGDDHRSVRRGHGDAYHELSLGKAKAGRYKTTLTLADDRRVLLATSFRLLDCVRTELSCQTVRFINSSANPAVTVKFQPSQDVDDLEAEKGLVPRKGMRDRGTIRLGPGEARNLWTHRKYLLWKARGPKNADGKRSNAGGDYAHVIPQRC